MSKKKKNKKINNSKKKYNKKKNNSKIIQKKNTTKVNNNKSNNNLKESLKLKNINLDKPKFNKKTKLKKKNDFNFKIIKNKIIKQDFNIPIYVLFLFTFIFLEMIFRIYCTEKFITLNFIYTIIYISGLSCILSLFTSLFNEKINKVITKILIFIITIWYLINIIYKVKLGVFFSIGSLGLANQLTSFLSDTLVTIGTNIIKIIISLIPLIISITFSNKITFIKKHKKNILKHIITFVIICLIFFTSLLINKNKTYSIYNLYFNVNNSSLTTEKYGVILSTSIELNDKIFKFKDNNLTITNNNDKKNEKETETKYNVLNIDFDTLNENTKDETKKLMNTYFKNEEPTKQNKYTGYYKDKNLILFMAESFNSFGVSKELTPTLYKLTNEAFVFENFYSPVILSTIGGEFQELTGLYPQINLLGSIWRRGTNYFEYGYANAFKKINYNTFAYHNNSYNFQNRDKYLKAIGFDNYTGCGNGLETKMNCKIWPQSDTEMIEVTIEDYINSEQPFMTYYVTVSGHMAYNWGNAMSKKHKHKVEHLDLPTNIKAYLATQIELDEALNTLIKKLEEAGKLDDTVIALVGDHYPYDLSINDINKASTYERDSIIEVNHSNFILWNNKTKTTKITKVGSQIDVLPTILNIFGIEYDSRLIIGKDILADNEGLAIFSNNSWITDKGKYFSSQNKFVPNENVTIEENYVLNINNIVNNKINMSKYIIQEDYYNYIFNENKQ